MPPEMPEYALVGEGRHPGALALGTRHDNRVMPAVRGHVVVGVGDTGTVRGRALRFEEARGVGFRRRAYGPGGAPRTGPPAVRCR
ncbi:MULTISPECIES: hypothetical protein [Streptomyces]|uniref:Uncharacterized protein n=1 Tax=Streptomyces sp. NBC_00093 TaxID=2975649 RepID=A0AAU2AD78_9ACTN